MKNEKQLGIRVDEAIEEVALAFAKKRAEQQGEDTTFSAIAGPTTVRVEVTGGEARIIEVKKNP